MAGCPLRVCGDSTILTPAAAAPPPAPAALPPRCSLPSCQPLTPLPPVAPPLAAVPSPARPRAATHAIAGLKWACGSAVARPVCGHRSTVTRSRARDPACSAQRFGRPPGAGTDTLLRRHLGLSTSTPKPLLFLGGRHQPAAVTRH